MLALIQSDIPYMVWYGSEHWYQWTISIWKCRFIYIEIPVIMIKWSLFETGPWISGINSFVLRPETPARVIDRFCPRGLTHWGRDKMDAIFQTAFSNGYSWMKMSEFTISLKFVPKVSINNIPALVQIMAWRRSGDKLLSEPMMDSLLTHIYILGLNELISVFSTYVPLGCDHWCDAQPVSVTLLFKYASVSESRNCLRFCCPSCRYSNVSMHYIGIVWNHFIFFYTKMNMSLLVSWWLKSTFVCLFVFCLSVCQQFYRKAY